MHRNLIYLARFSQINDVLAPKETPNMDVIKIHTIVHIVYNRIYHGATLMFSVHACKNMHSL